MSAPPGFRQRLEQTRADNFSSEIASIQLTIENDFIDLLEFRNGKFPRQETVDDIGIAQFALEPLQRIFRYRVMVIG